jgi:hypothetical protein
VEEGSREHRGTATEGDLVGKMPGTSTFLPGSSDVTNT